MIHTFASARVRQLGPRAPLSRLCPRAHAIVSCGLQGAEPRLYASAPSASIETARREAWLQLSLMRRERLRQRQGPLAASDFGGAA